MADEIAAFVAYLRNTRRFNPRPPVMADEICARAHIRNGLGRFNPRPPVMVDEIRATGRPRGPEYGFQSTSASNGGRNQGSRQSHGCRLGFNPRPPVMADEMLRLAADENIVDVSIHVRQ